LPSTQSWFPLSCNVDVRESRPVEDVQDDLVDVGVGRVDGAVLLMRQELLLLAEALDRLLQAEQLPARGEVRVALDEDRHVVLEALGVALAGQDDAAIQLDAGAVALEPQREV
jgi:hypothetical protein